MSNELTHYENWTLPALAERINKEHYSSLASYRDCKQHAKNCGDALIRAKELCKHGEYEKWCNKNTTISKSIRCRYINVAENWAKLNVSSAKHLPLEVAARLVVHYSGDELEAQVICERKKLDEKKEAKKDRAQPIGYEIRTRAQAIFDYLQQTTGKVNVKTIQGKLDLWKQEIKYAVQWWNRHKTTTINHTKTDNPNYWIDRPQPAIAPLAANDLDKQDETNDTLWNVIDKLTDNTANLTREEVLLLLQLCERKLPHSTHTYQIISTAISGLQLVN